MSDPSDYLLSDEQVRAFIAENPSEADGLSALAGSIAGARFEATRT